MAGAFVYLRITGENLDFHAINHCLAIKPSRTYKRGQTYKDGRTNEVIIYKEDCWQAGIEASDGESAEELLDRFLEKLEPDIPEIQRLAQCYSMALYLSVYPKERQCSLHFSRKTLQIIGRLNIAMGCGILYLGS